MKRLILITAAAASLATGMSLGEMASARDHDRGGQGQQRREQSRAPQSRGDQGRGNGDARRYEDRRPAPAPQRRDDRGDERRADERRGRRDDDRGPTRSYPGAYPPNALRQEAPRQDNARRGGYLREDRAPSFVEDYPRYRLRAPPRGYAWVRTANGYALVSMEDGRVFDVVPY